MGRPKRVHTRTSKKGKKFKAGRGSKWFHPTGTLSNWHKIESIQERRADAWKSHGGDPLRIARALMALSNVTKDKETKRKAREDARFFYAENRKTRGY